MKNVFLYRTLSTFIIIPLFLFLIVKNNLYFNLLLLFCLINSLKEWINMSYKKSFFLIGIIYLIFSFLNAYWLRNNDNGLFLFLFVIIICVCTDLGGYIFGNIIKGPKLTRISPKKTYSGVFGSYIFSFLGTYLYLYSAPYFFNINLNFDKIIFISVFAISTISQIGDLTVSFFKRRSNLKDTGKLIPGHGGILDRIDGIIFAIPAYNLIFLIFN